MSQRQRFSNAEGKTRARHLCRQSTPHERRLWGFLRSNQLGVKFRRQQPLGFYIADFVCFERGLVVELDGGQHATEQARNYDRARTEYLEGRNFRVLRFWNSEIDGNLNGVLACIVDVLGQQTQGKEAQAPLTPTLSRKGRGS